AQRLRLREGLEDLGVRTGPLLDLLDAGVLSADPGVTLALKELLHVGAFQDAGRETAERAETRRLRLELRGDGLVGHADLVGDDALRGAAAHQPRPALKAEL